jgi:hypothetical protein
MKLKAQKGLAYRKALAQTECAIKIQATWRMYVVKKKVTLAPMWAMTEFNDFEEISELEEHNLIDITCEFEISRLLNFEIFSKFGLTPHRLTLDTGQTIQGHSLRDSQLDEEERGAVHLQERHHPVWVSGGHHRREEVARRHRRALRNPPSYSAVRGEGERKGLMNLFLRKVFFQKNLAIIV